VNPKKDSPTPEKKERAGARILSPERLEPLIDECLVAAKEFGAGVSGAGVRLNEAEAALDAALSQPQEQGREIDDGQ